MVQLNSDLYSDQSTTMTKLKVHEVRFFDPKPRAIQGLAFEPESSRLAVVRCCVDEIEGRPAAYFIEIWNLTDSPCLEFKITLSREWRQSVEAVCWRSRRFLYVSGMHGHVLLLDVETGAVLKNAPAVSGPVWCLALNPEKTRLAAGTEDGFVSMFNVEDEDLLEYVNVLEPKGSRVLSLSWHPSKPLLVSSGRGRIWLWNTDDNTMKAEMRPPKAGKEEAIVSSVLLLRNSTIVSGDSGGSTIFWDLATGTPLTTFRSHRSGVLALAAKATEDGIRVFASGIDSLITEMRLITAANGQTTWVTAVPRYYHTHDVRALCHTGNNLVSGGADAHLCLSADMANVFTKIPPNTDVARVSVAESYLTPGVPLVLLQNSTRLEIWQLSSNQLESSEQVTNYLPADHFQLLKLTFGKGRELITTSAVSPHGEWLLVGSARLTRAYRLVLAKDAKNYVDLNLVAADISKDVFNQPVDRFAFSGSDEFVVADASSVYSCTATWNARHGQQSRRIARKTDICSLRPGERIRHLAVSTTGRYVVTVSSQNRVEVFDCKKAASPDQPMETDDDDPPCLTQWRTFSPPQSTSIVTSISLTAHSDPDLLLAYANGTVAAFNLAQQRFLKILDAPAAFSHSSVHGSLAVFHNWKEGVIVGRDGKMTWSLKHSLKFDEYLINSLLTSGGDLVNVVQTTSMLQNHLPPALAKKVFGV